MDGPEERHQRGAVLRAHNLETLTDKTHDALVITACGNTACKASGGIVRPSINAM